MTTYSFICKYDSIPATSPELSLITVDTITVYTSHDYNFNLVYDNVTRTSVDIDFNLRYAHNYGTTDSVFTFVNKDIDGDLYQLSLNYSFKYDDKDTSPVFINSNFNLSYSDLYDIDLASNTNYKFNLSSNIFIYQATSSKFDMKFQDRNSDSFFNDSVFVFMSQNTAGRTSERRYHFRFEHRESLPFSETMYFPFTTRKSIEFNNSPPVMGITSLGRYIYDYNASIDQIEIEYKDYVAIIDNGQKYSAYFAPFTIELGGSADLYNGSGISIRRTEILGGFAEIFFVIKDVDIESSISISLYQNTVSGYVNISADWKGWKTFINLSSFDEFGELVSTSSNSEYLVELPSESFKILPKQPDSCCLTRDENICELTPPRETNYIDPPEPVVCEKKLEVDAGRDLYAICDPQSTLEAKVSGDIPEGAVYSWEMIDGRIITWLSNTDQLIATYTSEFTDDKTFEFCVDKGGEFETCDTVTVFGTPQSTYVSFTEHHAIGNSVSSTISFTLDYLIGFNPTATETIQVVKNEPAPGTLVWKHPVNISGTIITWVIQQLVFDSWVTIAEQDVSEGRNYYNPELGSTFRILAISNRPGIIFTSNTIYANPYPSYPGYDTIYVTDVMDTRGYNTSLELDPNETNYTVTKRTKIEKLVEDEYYSSLYNAVQLETNEIGYQVIRYTKINLSVEDEYISRHDGSIQLNSNLLTYEVLSAADVGTIGG
ncbi:hypothetical protein N9242_00870 [Vicingaceae bacterium]|nr:hypothetical protein [Vicingaceae bacterium]